MRIQNTPFGKNPFKRSVAIITAALFLFTGFLNYAPLSFAQSVDIQVQGGNPSKDLSRLVRDVKVRIPPELGLVDEFYNAVPRTLNSEPQKVIFIQDAHDSLEAQENISKIINHLVAHDGVKTVFEEGYEGSVPTDKYFGFIKDPKIKEKVSWFFMDHLRLGGAEYAHINREKDFSLMGADSLKLHKENIEQYRLSAAKKNAIAKDLNALKKELKSLADSRFPKQLKEWLKTKEQFDAKKLDLFTYLGRSMVLLGTNTSNLGSRQNEKLIPLLRFTLEAVKSNDPVVIEKAKHIDAREVFDELIKLEQAIAETYLRDAADKQLFEYYKILSLLSRLNDLQVSQEEYESVKASLKTFDTDSFARFIFSRAPKTLILSRMWERNIRDAVKFYEIAADRDGAVSKTLNQYLAAGNGDRGAKESDVARSLGDGPRTAVLVYGGFHKENIKRILEAKNISYLVVSPRITKPSPRHEEFYRKLMTDGRLSYELPANLQMATRAESRIEVWEGANSSLARAEFQVMEEVARKMPNADPSTFGSAVEQALKVFAHQDPARPGMQEKSFPGLRSGGAGASSGTRKENKSGISGNDMDMAGLFSKSMKFLVKRIKQVRWINILHPALAYGLSEISCKVDSWVVGARFLAQHGLKPYYEFYDWAPDFISAFGAIQFSMAVLLLSKLTILKNLSIKTKTLAKGSHLFVSSLYTTLEIIIPILGIEIPLGLGRTFAWGDIAAYWGAAIVSWCIHDLLFNLEEKFSNKPADILTDPRGKQDESVKIGTYLVLNKPVDVITTEKPEKNAPEVKIAMDLIPANKRNGGHWVGRLDRASSGLLLYGDNNELNRLLLDPTLGQPEKAKKTYEVIVGGNMTKEDMETLKQGVTISVDGTKYFVRADKARVLERYFNGRHPMTKLEIVISEGKFHQVRKMMGALGHNVQALKRTAFGSIKLGDLPSGKIRELTPEEYTWLSDYYRSNRSEMRGKITGTSEIQSMAGGNDKFSSERVITFFSKGRGESLAEFFKDKRVLASVKDEIKKYLLFNLGVSLSLKKQEAETDLIFKKISAKEWVFLFQTPLREIEIKISDQEKGRSIRFSFHVHRDALMRENDAIPDEFFDNVSFRNVEFEFLTLKNSTYIADIFSRWMGRDFDLEHLFYDAPPVKTTLTADKTLVQDGNSLLDVLIPASRVVRPEGYEYSPENPIYVLVENYRTHIGLVDEIIPAIWDKDGLHFVFVGFQGWLRVKSVFSFSGVDKKEWGIPVCSVQSEKFNSSKMDCRGTKQEDLFSGMRDAGALETAPMVRGSGLAERVARYSWGISHAYTDQMVLGALNVPRGQSLLGHYANFEWPGSFGRLKRAHSEKDTALQVVGPYHIADHEQREFFFGSKERTGQSFVRAAHIARALGFSGVNINMCCPLTFFTEVGGGAGLTLNAELATHIVRSITQNVPQLAVSAKMLLLAKEKDRSQVDIPGSVAFAKALEQAGLSKLIVQAQTAEFGPMQPQAVKMIARAIKIPVVYNGNIVAYTETDLARSGFDARKYFSVEGLRNYFQGTVRRFMIGRILLSSPWSLAGRDYTNREIINLALQQAYLMLGVYAGTGEVGLSLFKIGVLYFLRSLKNPGIRENIVTQIENARSNNEIVSILEFFALPEQPNDGRGEMARQQNRSEMREGDAAEIREAVQQRKAEMPAVMALLKKTGSLRTSIYIEDDSWLSGQGSTFSVPNGVVGRANLIAASLLSAFPDTRVDIYAKKGAIKNIPYDLSRSHDPRVRWITLPNKPVQGTDPGADLIIEANSSAGLLHLPSNGPQAVVVDAPPFLDAEILYTRRSTGEGQQSADKLSKERERPVATFAASDPQGTVVLDSGLKEKRFAKDQWNETAFMTARQTWLDSLPAEKRDSLRQASTDPKSPKWDPLKAVWTWAYIKNRRDFMDEMKLLRKLFVTGRMDRQLFDPENKQILIHLLGPYEFTGYDGRMLTELREEGIRVISDAGNLFGPADPAKAIPVTVMIHHSLEHEKLLTLVSQLSGTFQKSGQGERSFWIDFPAYVTGGASWLEALSSLSIIRHDNNDAMREKKPQLVSLAFKELALMHPGLSTKELQVRADLYAPSMLMGEEKHGYENLRAWTLRSRAFSQCFYKNFSWVDDVLRAVAKNRARLETRLLPKENNKGAKAASVRAEMREDKATSQGQQLSRTVQPFSVVAKVTDAQKIHPKKLWIVQELGSGSGELMSRLFLDPVIWEKISLQDREVYEAVLKYGAHFKQAIKQNPRLKLFYEQHPGRMPFESGPYALKRTVIIPLMVPVEFGGEVYPAIKVKGILIEPGQTIEKLDGAAAGQPTLVLSYDPATGKTLLKVPDPSPRGTNTYIHGILGESINHGFLREQGFDVSPELGHAAVLNTAFIKRTNSGQEAQRVGSLSLLLKNIKDERLDLALYRVYREWKSKIRGGSDEENKRKLREYFMKRILDYVGLFRKLHETAIHKNPNMNNTAAYTDGLALTDLENVTPYFSLPPQARLAFLMHDFEIILGGVLFWLGYTNGKPEATAMARREFFDFIGLDPAQEILKAYFHRTNLPSAWEQGLSQGGKESWEFLSEIQKKARHYVLRNDYSDGQDLVEMFQQEFSTQLKSPYDPNWHQKRKQERMLLSNLPQNPIENGSVPSFRAEMRGNDAAESQSRERSEARVVPGFEKTLSDTRVPNEVLSTLKPVVMKSKTSVLRPWQILRLKQDVIAVIEQARIDALSPEMFRELLEVAGLNLGKLHLVIPDALQGKYSARVTELRKVASVHYGFPRLATSDKIPVIGFSDMEHDTLTAFQKRLDPKLAGRVKDSAFGLNQAGSFGVGILYALKDISPDQLFPNQNGFRYDKSGWYSAQVLEVLHAYTVISIAA